MVRVLHEVANLDGGGVARLLYDYYSYMDHTKIQFDFLINDQIADGILEEPLKTMGCRVFKVDSYKKNAKARLKAMEKIIKDGNYDVVHSHIAARSCFILRMAKKYGVKKRFVHSHIAYQNIPFHKRIIDKLFLCYAKLNATQLLACGEDAGRYMWGNRAVQQNHVLIMRNAVHTDKFKFNEAERERLQEELGIKGNKVIGIVGRLEKQKNHDFLLEIFAKVTEMEPNCVLLIVGRGSLENALKEKVKQLKIENKVSFLGVRSDVNKLLNAFDVFVLPSFYEGLPVVLVEAQANGLREVVSDTITKEMDVTDLIQFVSLTESADVWAQKIVEAVGTVHTRYQYAEFIKKAGYDIQNESQKMQSLYLKDR